MTTWISMRKQLAGTAMNGRAVYISIPNRDGVTPYSSNCWKTRRLLLTKI